MQRTTVGARTGLSLAEILIATVIFAVAGVPLYQVMSLGMRGAERTRDHMIAYAIAEKIQEQLNQMLHDEKQRQQAIDFQQPAPAPVTSIPFLETLKLSVQTAVAALPSAKPGDTVAALAALNNFKYAVTSKLDKPAGAPEAVWLSKEITVSWLDGRGKEKKVDLAATFTNTEIYHQVVKESYRNAQSITDQIMQNIMNKRQQPLVKYDTTKLKDELRTPMKSNEFMDPDPWYKGYLESDARLTVRARLGTEGQTSDERMAVKEAALAQFFGFTADQAKVRTYDLKNEAEEVVKRVENLPRYSDDFAELKGVEGVGVRPPGKPGAYACLNCHSPQFFATLDEGYLSIPKDYLAYKGPDGRTGMQVLEEYLQILKDNKGITDAEYKTYLAHLKSPDCGTCAGAPSK
ncbi:MAG: hypothetical protein HYY25_00170 [Candidatus Wallbacteria bacterium]|nr:hypothetical protein [Candidatus Wallbacteria bacterium]